MADYDFRGVFYCSSDFRGIFVILDIFGRFWSFSGFPGGILVIFIRFRVFLVILEVTWVF